MGSSTSKSRAERRKLEATSAAPIRVFHVGGMDCASCADAIERAVGKLDGVRGIQVDVMGGTVRVARDSDYGNEDLTRAIRRAGYTVRDRGADLGPLPAGRAISAAASGLLLLIGLALTWIEAGIAPEPFLAAATVAGAWYVVPKAWRAVRSRALDINVLMTIATGGAAVIGEWSEAAAVMFLFAVAQLLEGIAMSRARRAIAALMQVAPREATVRRPGGEQKVAVEEIAVGEVVLVRPGERIPLDGVVIAGHSAVNQAPITGESLPVDKEPGSEVFAGSINTDGVLEIRVTSLAEDSTLARIVHAVEEAQASRAPSQSFVDRFARVYTPAVVGLALIVALVPPLMFEGAWGTWVYRSLALLVIACPCALVISTPVTIVSGLTGAARAGVLLKGGAQLEALGGVSTVVFDKTGTLTTGRPVVTEVVGLDGLGPDDILRLAAAVERHSEHPVARSIVHAAESRGLTLPPVERFTALPGRGAQAVVEGTRFYVGNTRICEELGNCDARVHEAIARFERQGHTAVLLTTEQAALGVVAVADQPRPHASDSIAALRAAGIRRILMLSGDSPLVANRVGETLGVDEVRAGLLPQDKFDAVRQLRAQGERVAVVGDGVNDAPALAAADVGIAMGAAGTHIALEAADVVLMGDDLREVSRTIKRSRRTVRIIQQNITFSLAVKAVFLTLAILGHATLWLAVAADTGASLVVIANGLRALARPQYA
jgi:Cd2+/Zn2+-exporting ATPase